LRAVPGSPGSGHARPIRLRRLDAGFLRLISFRAQSLERGRRLGDGGLSLSNGQRICGGGRGAFRALLPFRPGGVIGVLAAARVPTMPRSSAVCRASSVCDLAHQVAELVIQPVDQPAALVDLIGRECQRLAFARCRRFEPFLFRGKPLDRLSRFRLMFALAFDVARICASRSTVPWPR
jgi:hypothetical protein